MNVDEKAKVIHNVWTGINKHVNVDLMVVNDMLNDLASQFKKHLEEESSV
jgi:hypothetical protein